MKRYKVTFERQVVYGISFVVEASAEDEAENKAGELLEALTDPEAHADDAPDVTEDVLSIEETTEDLYSPPAK